MRVQSKQFYKRILLADTFVIALALVFYFIFPPVHSLAIATATIVTTLNTLVGFYYIQKYLDASVEEFNCYIYGSTFGRLIAVMIMIGVVLLFSNFPQITFILSLFISYIYKSVLEIIFIHKNSTQRHEKS